MAFNLLDLGGFSRLLADIRFVVVARQIAWHRKANRGSNKCDAIPSASPTKPRRASKRKPGVCIVLCKAPAIVMGRVDRFPVKGCDDP